MKFDLNKIIESFNKLNDQARYGVLAGLVVLILVLDVFFLVLPQWGSINDISAQISKLTTDTQQVLVDRQRIGQLRKNLETDRLQLKMLSGKVRPVQEVPIILGIISRVANENGVKIDQLTPEKNLQESLKAAGEAKYYALPIVIKARCGYHMFGHFLNKLEGEDMYFIVKDFIIQNDGLEVNSHLFTLTIKVILLDQSPTQSKKP